MAFSEYPYIDYSSYNLDWIIKNAKELLARVKALESWEDKHDKEYQELKKILEDIYNGNLSPALIAALEKWLNKNGIDIIGNLVKAVFFGLTDAGYFIAYIPESWDEITFNTTGYDIFITEPEVAYGHLTLTY